MRFCGRRLRPNSAAATRGRRLFADAHRIRQEEQPAEVSSVVSLTLSVLRSTNPSSWSSDPNLGNLLSDLSPLAVVRVTGQLESFGHVVRFFNCLKVKSKVSDAVPVAFHAILEFAVRDFRGSPEKLYELFLAAKGEKIPISVNSASLLIKCFGKANMLNEMMSVFDGIDEEMKDTDVLNSVLLGLLECGRVDDALKLLDETLQRDSPYPPNRNTVGIVFSSILKRNPHGRSLIDEEIHTLFSRFDERGVSPDGFLLTQIVARFCRNSEYDMALNVLHMAMKSGSGIEVASCNAVLTGLGQKRDFQRMNLLMKAMQENGIKSSVVTYGIMIKHLCKFRRVDEALELVEKMRNDQHVEVEPDVVIFNTLIDGLCKIGRQEEGLNLMERMRSESKCKPNTITYNCLIDGYCKAGEIQKGHELFEQMSKEGMEHNVITVNTLLDGMCKVGNIGSAILFLNSMKEKGFKGNAVTYSILITAFCNVNNIDKAMKLFNKMQEDGCSPDAIVYYSLISGFCRAGRMDDAFSIVTKLKEVGLGLDIVTYNTLVGGFCRKNKLDKACEMVKDMEHAGVKPDQVTYNTLLSCCCAKGDFTSSLGLMRKMKDDGLTPTVVTFGALIQGYCTNGNLESAVKIFRDMCSSSSRRQPNTVIYNILIDAHCKNDDVGGAISLMKDMKQKGVRANATTYNALFKGLQERNWYEKAFEFMDQMTREGCRPDAITMEILTEWLSSVGENEKLRKFVQGFKIHGFH